ncbi:hypothetical protein HDU76_002644 [Blyttiomyces sp. JEL0837]|nr:hypothetical protein HDU76_002644 [Blyttiomyces sp. JEL0837]
MPPLNKSKVSQTKAKGTRKVSKIKSAFEDIFPQPRQEPLLPSIDAKETAETVRQTPASNKAPILPSKSAEQPNELTSSSDIEAKSQENTPSYKRRNEASQPLTLAETERKWEGWPVRLLERAYDVNLKTSHTPDYEPLSDTYLVDYFNSPRIRAHLMSMGLIREDGSIVPARQFKLNQIRLEKEEYEQNVLKAQEERDLDREIEIAIRRHAIEERKIYQAGEKRLKKPLTPGGSAQFPAFLSQYPVTMWRTASIYGEKPKALLYARESLVKRLEKAGKKRIKPERTGAGSEQPKTDVGESEVTEMKEEFPVTQSAEERDLQSTHEAHSSIGKLFRDASVQLENGNMLGVYYVVRDLMCELSRHHPTSPPSESLLQSEELAASLSIFSASVEFQLSHVEKHLLAYIKKLGGNVDAVLDSVRVFAARQSKTSASQTDDIQECLYDDVFESHEQEATIPSEEEGPSRDSAFQNDIDRFFSDQAVQEIEPVLKEDEAKSDGTSTIMVEAKASVVDSSPAQQEIQVTAPVNRDSPSSIVNDIQVTGAPLIESQAVVPERTSLQDLLDQLCGPSVGGAPEPDTAEIAEDLVEDQVAESLPRSSTSQMSGVSLVSEELKPDSLGQKTMSSEEILDDLAGSEQMVPNDVSSTQVGTVEATNVSSHGSVESVKSDLHLQASNEGMSAQLTLGSAENVIDETIDPVEVDLKVHHDTNIPDGIDDSEAAEEMVENSTPSFPQEEPIDEVQSSPSVNEELQTKSLGSIQSFTEGASTQEETTKEETLVLVNQNDEIPSDYHINDGAITETQLQTDDNVDDVAEYDHSVNDVPTSTDVFTTNNESIESLPQEIMSEKDADQQIVDNTSELPPAIENIQVSRSELVETTDPQAKHSADSSVDDMTELPGVEAGVEIGDTYSGVAPLDESLPQLADGERTETQPVEAEVGAELDGLPVEEGSSGSKLDDMDDPEEPIEVNTVNEDLNLSSGVEPQEVVEGVELKNVVETYVEPDSISPHEPSSSHIIGDFEAQNVNSENVEQETTGSGDDYGGSFEDFANEVPPDSNSLQGSQSMVNTADMEIGSLPDFASTSNEANETLTSGEKGTGEQTDVNIALDVNETTQVSEATDSGIPSSDAIKANEVVGDAMEAPRTLPPDFEESHPVQVQGATDTNESLSNRNEPRDSVKSPLMSSESEAPQTDVSSPLGQATPAAEEPRVAEAEPIYSNADLNDGMQSIPATEPINEPQNSTGANLADAQESSQSSLQYADKTSLSDSTGEKSFLESFNDFLSELPPIDQAKDKTAENENSYADDYDVYKSDDFEEFNRASVAVNAKKGQDNSRADFSADESEQKRQSSVDPDKVDESAGMGSNQDQVPQQVDLDTNDLSMVENVAVPTDVQASIGITENTSESTPEQGGGDNEVPLVHNEVSAASDNERNLNATANAANIEDPEGYNRTSTPVTQQPLEENSQSERITTSSMLEETKLQTIQQSEDQNKEIESTTVPSTKPDDSKTYVESTERIQADSASSSETVPQLHDDKVQLPVSSPPPVQPLQDMNDIQETPNQDIAQEEVTAETTEDYLDDFGDLPTADFNETGELDQAVGDKSTSDATAEPKQSTALEASPRDSSGQEQGPMSSQGSDFSLGDMLPDYSDQANPLPVSTYDLSVGGASNTNPSSAVNRSSSLKVTKGAGSNDNVVVTRQLRKISLSAADRGSLEGIFPDGDPKRQDSSVSIVRSRLNMQSDKGKGSTESQKPLGKVTKEEEPLDSGSSEEEIDKSNLRKASHQSDGDIALSSNMPSLDQIQELKETDPIAQKRMSVTSQKKSEGGDVSAVDTNVVETGSAPKSPPALESQEPQSIADDTKSTRSIEALASETAERAQTSSERVSVGTTQRVKSPGSTKCLDQDFDLPMFDDAPFEVMGDNGQSESIGQTQEQTYYPVEAEQRSSSSMPKLDNSDKASIRSSQSKRETVLPTSEVAPSSRDSVTKLPALPLSSEASDAKQRDSVARSPVKSTSSSRASLSRASSVYGTPLSKTGQASKKGSSTADAEKPPAPAQSSSKPPSSRTSMASPPAPSTPPPPKPTNPLRKSQSALSLTNKTNTTTTKPESRPPSRPSSRPTSRPSSRPLTRSGSRVSILKATESTPPPPLPKQSSTESISKINQKPMSKSNSGNIGSVEKFGLKEDGSGVEVKPVVLSRSASQQLLMQRLSTPKSIRQETPKKSNSKNSLQESVRGSKQGSDFSMDFGDLPTPPPNDPPTQRSSRPGSVISRSSSVVAT